MHNWLLQDFPSISPGSLTLAWFVVVSHFSYRRQFHNTSVLLRLSLGRSRHRFWEIWGNRFGGSCSHLAQDHAARHITKPLLSRQFFDVEHLTRKALNAMSVIPVAVFPFVCLLLLTFCSTYIHGKDKKVLLLKCRFRFLRHDNFQPRALCTWLSIFHICGFH